jgi:hypothetical protein
MMLAVAHAHAAVRARHAHRLIVAGAVHVDVAPHRVDLAAAVAPGLLAAQPQDARQDPVAPWMCGGELRRPYLAGRPPPAEHRTAGAPAPMRARMRWRPRGVHWLPLRSPAPRAAVDTA